MDTTEILTTDSKSNIYAGHGWIRTAYGKFDMANPTFDIWDIGFALGMNCRYNGHTKGFYSVAEHSVKVNKIMGLLGGGEYIEGLLHDATEAYLTDVPAPFKQYLPDWRALDASLDEGIRATFRVGPKSDLCKHADWLMLFIEANELIDGKGTDFQDPNGYRAEALALADKVPSLRPGCWDPITATDQYMHECATHGLSGNVRM